MNGSNVIESCRLKSQRTLRLSTFMIAENRVTECPHVPEDRRSNTVYTNSKRISISGSIPDSGRDFSVRPASRPAVGSSQPLVQLVPPELEADRSLLSNAESNLKTVSAPEYAYVFMTQASA